jgi:pyrroloquinoline quinone biosynthesis protein E
MSAAGSESSVNAPVKVDGEGLPLWLLLELTYRCPLKCPWCNNPVDFDRYRNELTTEEWVDVLRQGRELGALQLGFSGGEPMQRRDLEELVGEATRLGYYTNLITSGMGLNEQRLASLQRAGLKQVQLSLQACDAELNNRLVGADAYAHKIAAARAIKARGFPMVLNVPVSRYHIEPAPALLALAEELGIEYVEFANLQYYNWALLNRSDLLPTREQLTAAEAVVAETRARLGRRMTIYFVITDYYAERPKACMKGWGNIHLTIAPDGAALPCQEARVIEGLKFPNVRDHDLGWIWRESPVFQKFRGESWMQEPCRSCPERGHDYGGCRCQAFLLNGDAASTDPVCGKSPHHHLIEEAVAAAMVGRSQNRLIMRQRGLNVA